MAFLLVAVGEEERPSPSCCRRGREAFHIVAVAVGEEERPSPSCCQRGREAFLLVAVKEEERPSS